MTRLHFACLTLLLLSLLAGCNLKDKFDTEPAAPVPAPDDTSKSLADARKGFTTKLANQQKANQPVAEPPAKQFRKVKYDSPAGKLAAYVTPDPKDGKKRPAIVWITGGDCSTIDEGSWKAAPPANDQSARQYRDAGLVMMFPSLRGGNDNPGVQENFYGEVDDVLAAAEYLAKQEYVDPKRIYLGGHSTGGTLTLLVAEVPNKFRAVFSFGPVEDIKGYGGQFTDAVNTKDPNEVKLRSPGYWLGGIQCPTFVFEGTVEGNISALQAMAKANTNPKAKFFPVKGATHFSVLAPVNKIVAQKIVADTGAETNLAFTEAELNKPFGK